MPEQAMKSQSLHGASWLALWFCWLLAGQGSGSARADLWVALSIAAALVLAPRRLWSLWRRLRWLFVAIAITFALGTPGTLLVPDLSGGPTVEGVRIALRTGLHLAAMAACVAVLMHAMTLPVLAGALHRLLHPRRADRPGADSFALRLQLVLRDLDNPSWRGRWHEWMQPPADTAPIAVEPCAPLTRLDLLAVSAGAATCIAWTILG